MKTYFKLNNLRSLVIIVFALFAPYVKGQITREDYARGDSFDNNIHTADAFPSNANDDILGMKSNIESVDFYRDLRLKGKVRSFKQISHNVQFGTEEENLPIQIDIQGRKLRLTEKHNINAEFDSNRNLLQIDLYNSTGKTTCSITNKYIDSKIDHSYIVMLNEKMNPVETDISFLYKDNKLQSKISKSDNYSVSSHPVKDGFVCERLNFTYGKNGRLAKELKTTYFENKYGNVINPDKERLAVQYEYDGEGNLSKYNSFRRITYLYKSKKLWKINDYYTILYNAKGQIVKKTYQVPGEKSYSELKYYYYSNSAIEKIVCKTYQSEENYYITTYRYNETNDVTLEERISYSDLDFYKSYRLDFDYEYDEIGNWTKRTDRLFGNVARIINREIQYY